MIHINDIVDRFFMIEFPDFLESAEVIFDGVEVGRVWRKEKQCCASALDQFPGLV